MSVRASEKAGFESLRIRSPAKVNLRLEVLGKRPNGYHDIRSVMVPIGLADSLHIALTQDESREVFCNRPDLPVDERNLAYRAASLLLESVGGSKGFKIRIEKRIPVGSGLGGGSSNAASTLLGMSQLMGAHLARADLMRMAVELGADVSFFLFGRPALATGIGEHLEPLAGLPRFWFVLVYPGICVSSRWAYSKANLWLTNPGDHINMPAFSWDIGNLRGILQNDLERVVAKEYPVVQFIKQRFLDLGAVGSLMSGSGSTVFGLYLSRRDAHQAYHQMKGGFKGRDWEIFLSRSTGY